MLSGLATAAGGGAFFESVTFTSATGRTLRIVVSALLIGLGLVQVGMIADTSFRAVERVAKNLNRTQAQLQLRRRHPVVGFTAALLAFATAATVIVVLMFTPLGDHRPRPGRDGRAAPGLSPTIKKWGGTVLVGIGAWFVVLGVFADRFAGLFAV